MHGRCWNTKCLGPADVDVVSMLFVWSHPLSDGSYFLGCQEPDYKAAIGIWWHLWGLYIWRQSLLRGWGSPALPLCMLWCAIICHNNMLIIHKAANVMCICIYIYILCTFRSIPRILAVQRSLQTLSRHESIRKFSIFFEFAKGIPCPHRSPFWIRIGTSTETGSLWGSNKNAKPIWFNNPNQHPKHPTRTHRCYPLVNVYIAMENHYRNSGFSH